MDIQYKILYFTLHITFNILIFMLRVRLPKRNSFDYDRPDRRNDELCSLQPSRLHLHWYVQRVLCIVSNFYVVGPGLCMSRSIERLDKKYWKARHHVLSTHYTYSLCSLFSVYLPILKLNTIYGTLCIHYTLLTYFLCPYILFSVSLTSLET